MPQKKPRIKEDVIETYSLVADNVRADISIIVKGKSRMYYHANILRPSEAVHALIDEIKKELVLDVSLAGREITDVRAMAVLKKKFAKTIREIIDKNFPSLEEEEKKYLTGRILHETLGLGDLEILFADPELEEIIINSSQEPVWVYHKRHGWLQTNIWVESEDQIRNYANTMARRVGRQINTLNPLLDAHLITRDRANAVLYPIANKGHTITIRKFTRSPWTCTDFINNNTVSSEAMALIWLLMQYEMNIIFSGGTASGKTSFMGVTMPFIPPNQRIITIEDTRELQLPDALFWTPLTTREPNAEGRGGVTMLDLLVNALRMRPDRIILGEIREKRQAEVLFEAMHTGHSVYATLHANTADETLRRLTNPPLSIPPIMVKGIHLNVVLFRDRARGLRRVMQLAEYVETGSGSSLSTRLIYRWKPSTDTLVRHAEEAKIFEDLSRITGLTMREIDEEIEKKKMILEWMVLEDVTTIEKVGRVMDLYYMHPEMVEEIAQKGRPYSEIEEYVT